MSKALVLLLLIKLLLLSGCTSLINTPLKQSTNALLKDNHYPSYHAIEIETPDEIFYLSEEAKNFASGSVNTRDTSANQLLSFTSAIFDHSSLDLLYMSNANTVADDTFNNRAANCLSMSIMVYAMAKHVGFKADFKNVLIPEYWTRREGFSLLNGHINVEISPEQQPGLTQLIHESLEVDFDPQSARSSFKKERVKEHQIIAMFYNNKGAEALINKNYTEAYAYLRQALLLSPKFQSAWVNIGFLYRRSGLLESAEQAYLAALSIDKHNSSAIENLAYLYYLTDRNEQAKLLRLKLNRQLQSNPYYHFNLGERDLEANRYKQALVHYRTALQLDKSKHEIYFGLAKVHFALGDIRRSQRYLVKAKKKSNNRQDQSLYQGKLDLLSASTL